MKWCNVVLNNFSTFFDGIFKMNILAGRISSSETNEIFFFFFLQVYVKNVTITKFASHFQMGWPPAHVRYARQVTSNRSAVAMENPTQINSVCCRPPVQKMLIFVQ